MRTILVYDTTLRDGTQGEGVSLSLQDKLNVAARLAEFGVDMIEGGYPLSNEKDVQFFQRVKELNLGRSKIAAFGMTRRRGVLAQDDPGMKALVAANSDVITVVGKSWDFHATDVLNVSLDENIAMISESVEFCAKYAEVVYDAEHFFDGYKANPEYALNAIYNAAMAGAKWVVLCDTNGGSLPEEIAQIVAAAKQKLSSTQTKLGIHCHNDGDMATANSLAAVDAGCDHIQGTINGVGERCGNADLLALMANLVFKKKGYTINCRDSLGHLTELSRFVYETANLQLRNNQPFVGQSAFAHKGGMHVHAINKAASTYEHMDPELVGNERRILVSELSGDRISLQLQRAVLLKIATCKRKFLRRWYKLKMLVTNMKQQRPHLIYWCNAVLENLNRTSKYLNTASTLVMLLQVLTRRRSFKSTLMARHVSKVPKATAPSTLWTQHFAKHYVSSIHRWMKCDC